MWVFLLCTSSSGGLGWLVGFAGCLCVGLGVCCADRHELLGLPRLPRVFLFAQTRSVGSVAFHVAVVRFFVYTPLFIV